jgi:hypothetical protein
MLNRNYLYAVPLYNVFHGGNAVESIVRSILTIQGNVKNNDSQYHSEITFYKDVEGNKKRKQKRHILTEERLDGVGTLLEASLKKSLCLLALHCGFAKSTVHIGTMLLTF